MWSNRQSARKCVENKPGSIFILIVLFYQLSTNQILHYLLGKKMKLIWVHQKVVYVNGWVKRRLLELFLDQKLIPWGPM